MWPSRAEVGIQHLLTADRLKLVVYSTAQNYTLCLPSPASPYLSLFLFALCFVSPTNLSLGEQPHVPPLSPAAPLLIPGVQVNENPPAVTPGQLCGACTDFTPRQHLRTALGPRGPQAAETIRSSTLSTEHLSRSCSRSPMTPVSAALIQIHFKHRFTLQRQFHVCICSLYEELCCICNDGR